MEQAHEQSWGRETLWRQGCVLANDAVKALLPQYKDELASIRVVVIQHDCDLANEDLNAEPNVEVIVGRLLDKPNGSFTWGKSPRTLHHHILLEGQSRYIELVSTKKISLQKERLAQFNPSDEYEIDGQSLATLRSWLGSRYNRAAFPDAFVNRMRITKAEEKLNKVLANFGHDISFVFFDVDEGVHVERLDGDPYELSIVLVYPPGQDADAAHDNAEKVVEKINAAIQSRLVDGNEITLKTCFSISKDDLPVSHAKLLTQWRLEYMTHRADVDQPGPPEL